MVSRSLDLGKFLGKEGSSFLFGARGTGKTYLAAALLKTKPHALQIDLLDQRTFLRYLSHPGALREEVQTQWERAPGKPLFVLIDEVQKVPALLDVVHSLFNENPRGVQFLLTGSSARKLKLKRGGANLLAGRAYVAHLHPLTHREVRLNLPKALQFGTLPGLYVTEAKPEAWLEAYVGTYLKEEIQQEALVRKLDSFTRFLEFASQAHGEPVNFSKMVRQGIASVPTIQDYFSILVDTLIAFRLDGWSTSVRRQLLQAPKFYFFDCGVLNALRGELRTELRPSSYRYGKLFETWVILEMIRLNDYAGTGYRFAYWRTNTGLEVDVILYRNAAEPPIAVEIKSGNAPAEQDLKALLAFKKENPKAKMYCFSQAPRARLVHGIRILPWQEGLDTLFV
jgi:predicted AAA+ superfamily ATPase